MNNNNEVIIIDRATFKVYIDLYNDCKEFIGKGENLEKAVDIAEKHIRKKLGNRLHLEYGIRFYRGQKTFSEVMVENKIKKQKERNVWYCQNSDCGKKCYKNDYKFYICKECFEKLKKGND